MITQVQTIQYTLASGEVRKVQSNGTSISCLDTIGDVDIAFVVNNVQTSFSDFLQGITYEFSFELYDQFGNLSFDPFTSGKLSQGQTKNIVGFDSFILKNNSVSTQSFKIILSNGKIRDNRLVISETINVNNSAEVMGGNIGIATINAASETLVLTGANINAAVTLYNESDVVIRIGKTGVKLSPADGYPLQVGASMSISNRGSIYARAASGEDKLLTGYYETNPSQA